jgi:hypothetical protein
MDITLVQDYWLQYTDAVWRHVTGRLHQEQWERTANKRKCSGQTSYAIMKLYSEKDKYIIMQEIYSYTA